MQSKNSVTVEDVEERSGLSRFNLHVYAAMHNKKTPLRVDTLFHIICPNREIRSLSRDTIRAHPLANATSTTSRQGSPSSDAAVAVVVSKPKKPVKRGDDDLRKMIIKERDTELVTNGVKIAGTTNGKKTLPLDEKDAKLRWEFLAWGHATSDFYVFLYYIGPQEKGRDDVELSRNENWMIVPESHLSIFHKGLGAVDSKFKHGMLSVKESIDKRCHIQYDVRYILHKWKNCLNEARKERVSFLNQHLSLFESKDTPRVKEHKKRKLEESKAAAAASMPTPKQSAIDLMDEDDTRSEERRVGKEC